MTAAPTSPPSATRVRTISPVTRLLSTFGIWGVLFVLLLIGFTCFPKFGHAENLLNILRNVTLLGIVAIGVTFITYSRHYLDLSIPAIMAFTGLVAI